VPVQNKTAGRKPDWRGYYTPAIIPQAKQSFGPFMRRWGYRFPQEWGEVSVAWRWEVWFRVWSAGQRAYLKHLRYNDSMVGKAGRALRARFIR
jgi:hypothetical protein